MNTERLNHRWIGPEVLHHPYRGMYIAFEGPEGGGKSTQKDLLVSSLESWGIPVLGVREPGGTPLGKELRELIVAEKNPTTPVSSAEVYLFGADRAQLIEEKLRPQLVAGGIVVEDRSFLSSMTYQGGGRDLGVENIWLTNSLAVGNIVPDLVIYMDVPSEIGLSRRMIAGGVNRLDLENIQFHRKVRAVFEELASRDTERWSRVPYNMSIEHQHEWVLSKVINEARRKGLVLERSMVGAVT